MISRLKSYIRDHKLFDEKQQLLLGVSGGVDSMVLLHLLHSAGYSVTVGHMNFRLRGEYSDKDENLVKTVCDQLGVSCFSTQADTMNYSQDKGISIQMAARELRYDWFTSVMLNHGLDFLVTAHHADDLIETTLFNLTKGTGLSGLRAMRPADGVKRRPLLFASKDDVYEYAKENNVSWREDESNRSSKYARNKIRNEVLPHLKEINPSVTENFNYTHRRLLGAEALVKRVVSETTSKYLKTDDSGVRLDLCWVDASEASEVIMSEILRPYQFSFRQTQQVVKAFFAEGGKVFFSENYQLDLDREALVISNIAESADAISITVHENTLHVDTNGDRWLFKKVEKKDFLKSENGDLIFLDFDRLRFPLTIRNWSEGDWFKPLGMGGKRKKMSDFLIDAKVPLKSKKEVLVLTTEDEICCVMGQRPGESFKMTPESSLLYQIERQDFNVQAPRRLFS